MNEFTTQLSNCTLTKVDLDTEHHYYIDGDYAVSVTQIIGMGAPKPEGLLQYFKEKSADEIEERLMMTRDRGVKLHRALESLVSGLELYMEDYPTQYEKAGIVAFIRCMRFLAQYGSLSIKSLNSEYVAADTKLRVGGTIDVFCRVDKRALEILENPTHKLKLIDDSFELVKPLAGRKKVVGCIIDNKFTGRTAYDHKIQATKYKHMNNLSYPKKRASEAFIWRFSPQHKFGFSFQNAAFHLKQRITPKSFKRLYETALEASGGYPDPPKLVIYPETVRLFEKVKK